MITKSDFFYLLAKSRPSTSVQNAIEWFDLISIYKETIRNAYQISESKVEFSRHIFKLGYAVNFAQFVYDNWSEIYGN